MINNGSCNLVIQETGFLHFEILFVGKRGVLFLLNRNYIGEYLSNMIDDSNAFVN